jgi:chromosome segregation ATPase
MATTAADAAECVRLQAELVKATGLLAAARAAAYQAEVQLQSTHAYAAAAAQEARTLAAENARLQAHVEAADRQLRQLSAALSRQQQQVLPQEERQGQQRRQEGAWRQPVAASGGQRLPPPQQHQHEAAGSTADLAQVVEQLRRELAEVRREALRCLAVLLCHCHCRCGGACKRVPAACAVALEPAAAAVADVSAAAAAGSAGAGPAGGSPGRER